MYNKKTKSYLGLPLSVKILTENVTGKTKILWQNNIRVY